MRNSEPGWALHKVMTDDQDRWTALPEHQRKIWAEREALLEVALRDDAWIACQSAVVHVLRRIKEDHYLRTRLGVGTDAFRLLTNALAKLTGEPVAAVRERIIPGSGAIPP